MLGELLGQGVERVARGGGFGVGRGEHWAVSFAASSGRISPPSLEGEGRVGGGRGGRPAAAGTSLPALAEMMPGSPPTLPSPSRGEGEDSAAGFPGYHEAS